MFRYLLHGRRFLSLALLPALWLFSGAAPAQGAAAGHREEAYPPADSPFWSSDSHYWLTLSDSLTPAELRAALMSPAEHQRRYQEAATIGRVEPVENLGRVSYCVIGSLTPELFRAAEVFEMFSYRSVGHPTWPEDTRERLSAYDLSDEGIDAVLTLAERNWNERSSLMDELRPQKEEFLSVLRKAKEELGPASYGAAARDVEVLSRVSGRPASEITSLLAAWHRDPEEVSIRNLVGLSKALSASDWNGFRAFLLREVAPTMVALDVAPEEPRR